jgi:regulatory protein
VRQKNKTPIDFQKILDKAYRFLSLRPRSEKELVDYLKKRKVSPLEFEKIFKILREQNLINDFSFADWWIEQRETFRPKGKIALKMELRQKGIAGEIIESALSRIDEESLAQKALAKKIETYRKLPQEEFFRKVSQFLSYRGFSWQTIEKVAKKFKNVKIEKS